MKYIVEFEDEPCMYEDEVHFYKCIQAPWWGLSERVIKQLTPYQPDAPDTNVGNITNLCAHENDPISRQMVIDTIMGQPPEPHYPSWYAAQIEKLPAAQPDHNADIGKKVSISCGQENDLISRQAAIDALARMMPRSYTPDGSHPADEEIFRAQEVFVDCIEALEILPTAQPEPHWIPCTERMPHNTGDFYLCTAKLSVDDEYEVELLMLDTANDFDKSYFSKCIHNGLVFRESWSGGNEALDVIAWMPLPEPYRGGDSNE